MGPHTGIAEDPWAGVLGPAVIAPSTRLSGNAPPFRAASIVKSVGGLFKADATGPSPFAEDPWQEAQCARYKSFEACIVWFVGSIA
jgi:hypothetical protein